MATVTVCAKCLVELIPGRGDFFVVSIDAVVDPTGPVVAVELSAEEIQQAIDETLRQLEGVSELEGMNQVRRRLTLHLCNRCFVVWIEDPVGA